MFLIYMMMSFSELDGRRFFYSFYAGALRLFEHQQEINRLNVYPVPDADTGTNLASTLRSVIDSTTPQRSYKATTIAVAEAALTGARGNSGIIFAQFLSGLNEETQTSQSVTVKEFALSVKNSIKYLYEAISNPVEGTILTVIREWAEYVYENAHMEDFRVLLQKAYIVAEESLAGTSEKIKALTSVSVVDAGAKGFVVFLKGINDFLRYADIRRLLNQQQVQEAIIPEVEIEHDRINFRYCTEVLIKGENLERKQVEQMAEAAGDSVVVAGTSGMIRLHVHTDHPEELIDHLRPMGTLSFQKADDMLAQYRAAHEQKYKIALVTDSACDLPDTFLEEYQVNMVPIHLYIDDNQYLDKVTIKPDRFYEIIDKEKVTLRTSQPTVKSFVNLYSRLTSHYDSVVAVHLGSTLSGTWNTSRQAAEKVMKETGKKISVIDSKSLSGGLALQVHRVALLIAGGKSHSEIVQAAIANSGKPKVYASAGSMKQLIRSGRVSRMKGLIGKLLHVRPVVTINQDGVAYLTGKALTRKGSLQNIIRFIKEDPDFRGSEYIVMHANDPDTAGIITQRAMKYNNKPPFTVINIATVFGAHLGAGTVAIAYLPKN